MSMNPGEKTLRKKVVREIVKIFRDTLQDRFNKYSRTSCTMLAALIVGFFMALWDFFVSGFRYDVWMFIMSVGVGIKLIDAQSKKIQKTEENELHKKTE